jgi:hypothetical protein
MTCNKLAADNMEFIEGHRCDYAALVRPRSRYKRRVAASRFEI